MSVLVALVVLVALAIGLFLVKGAVLALVGLLVFLLAPFVLFASIGASILGDFFKLMGDDDGHHRGRRRRCGRRR